MDAVESWGSFDKRNGDPRYAQMGREERRAYRRAVAAGMVPEIYAEKDDWGEDPRAEAAYAALFDAPPAAESPMLSYITDANAAFFKGAAAALHGLRNADTPAFRKKAQHAYLMAGFSKLSDAVSELRDYRNGTFFENAQSPDWVFIAGLTYLAVAKREPAAVALFSKLTEKEYPEVVRIFKKTMGAPVPDGYTTLVPERAVDHEPIDPDDPEPVSPVQALLAMLTMAYCVANGRPESALMEGFLRSCGRFEGVFSSSLKDHPSKRFGISNGSGSVFSGLKLANDTPEEALRSTAKKLAEGVLGHRADPGTEVSAAAASRQWKAALSAFADAPVANVPNMPALNEEEAYVDTVEGLLTVMKRSQVEGLSKADVASLAVVRALAKQVLIEKRAAVEWAVETFAIGADSPEVAKEAEALIATAAEASARASVSEELSASGDRIAELEAEVARLKDELRTSQARLAKSASRVSSLEASLDELEAELTAPAAEGTPESASLPTASAAEEEPEESVIARLGTARVLLVTGSGASLAKFRAAFPNWRIATDEDRVTSDAKALVRGVDAVVIDAINIAHSTYFKFRAAVESEGVPCVAAPRVRNLGQFARGTVEKLEAKVGPLAAPQELKEEEER